MLPPSLPLSPLPPPPAPSSFSLSSEVCLIALQTGWSTLPGVMSWEWHLLPPHSWLCVCSCVCEREKHGWTEIERKCVSVHECVSVFVRCFFEHKRCHTDGQREILQRLLISLHTLFTFYFYLYLPQTHKHTHTHTHTHRANKCYLKANMMSKQRKTWSAFSFEPFSPINCFV